MFTLFRRHVVENPLFGRHLSTTLTGPRLGVAFLLVNSVLLIVYLSLFASFLGARQGEMEVLAGPALYFAHFVTLYCLLCILLPVKIAGHLEGARVGRVFDQVVVTGTSPLRIHFGSWSVGVLYGALILLVSLPFAGGAYLLGDVSLALLAEGYVVLFLYSSVIVLVTLALSLFEREWVTTPTAIGGFLLLGVLGVIVGGQWIALYPQQLAEITPMRFFYRQAELTTAAWNPTDPTDPLFGDPVFFSTAVPLSIYSHASWALVAAGALLILALGPAHRFQPGFNNFGSVVLPGDRWRRLFRRLRAALNRHVEVAFLYENRPRWCERWDYALRSLLGVGTVLLLWGVISGEVYGGNYSFGSSPGRGVTGDDLYLFSFYPCCVVLGVWILNHCDPKHKVYWRERIGPLEIPRERALLVTFLLLSALLLALQHHVLTSATADFLGSYAGRPPDPSVSNQKLAPAQAVDFYARQWWALTPGILLFLLNCFLLGRLFSRLAHSVHFVRLVTIAGGFFIQIVPLLAVSLSNEGYLPPYLIYCGSLSSVLLVDAMGVENWSFGDRVASYYASHAILATSLLALLVLAHAAHRRRNRKRAGLSAAVLIATLATSGSGSLAQDVSEPEPQDSPLVIEDVSRGFRGVVFTRQADFFTVVLRNEGLETLRGGFWLATEDPSWSGRRHGFEIGPRTTRVIRWSGEGDRSWFDPAYFPARLEVEASGARVTTDFETLQVIDPDRRRNTTKDPLPYLLVGPDRGPPPTAWLTGQLVKAHRCSSRYLPENPTHYRGVAALIIGPEDLSMWTDSQRRALYDYVRLGGSIVFHGSWEQFGLAGSGVWRELLRSTRSRKVDVGEVLLRVEELEEGKQVLWLAEVDGKLVRVEKPQQIPAQATAIPALTVRSVGAGHISHLSVDWNGAPGALPDDFWDDLAWAIPVSRFPFLVSSGFASDDYLQDPSSLYTIVGYFALYTLALGFGLIFFFRRRERRKLVWFAIPATSLLFLAAVPFLNALLHTRPSFAELREVVYFGRGSSRGVLIGHVQVRSSGRQHHQVTLEGHRLAAFPLHHPFDRRSSSYARGPRARAIIGPRIELAELSERAGSYHVDLLTRPWASRHLTLLGDVVSSEPVEGVAVYDRSQGTLSYRVRLPVPPANDRLSIITHDLLGTKFVQEIEDHPRRVDGFHEGTILADKGRHEGHPRRIYQSRQTLKGPGRFSLLWNVSVRPRVFVAWSPADVAKEQPWISSPDLSFERELADPSRMRRYRGAVFEHRGDRTFWKFRHRLCLVELPLEVR
ncbi:MAG: hypothetical protein O7J95_08265 [Planctomycetota bacterium]|nr:hypothetical protein [Planctomycetota bacterium]